MNEALRRAYEVFFIEKHGIHPVWQNWKEESGYIGYIQHCMWEAFNAGFDHAVNCQGKGDNNDH